MGIQLPRTHTTEKPTKVPEEFPEEESGQDQETSTEDTLRFDPSEFSTSKPEETDEKRSSSPPDDTTVFSSLLSKISSEYIFPMDKPKKSKGIIYNVFESPTEIATIAVPMDADILNALLHSTGPTKAIKEIQAC